MDLQHFIKVMTFIHNYLCYGNKELPNAKQMTWGFASEFLPVNSPQVLLKGPPDGSLDKFSALVKCWSHILLPISNEPCALHPTELFSQHNCIDITGAGPDSHPRIIFVRKKPQTFGRRSELTSAYQRKRSPSCTNSSLPLPEEGLQESWGRTFYKGL